jgi:hypothetical protein
LLYSVNENGRLKGFHDKEQAHHKLISSPLSSSIFPKKRIRSGCPFQETTRFLCFYSSLFCIGGSCRGHVAQFANFGPASIRLAAVLESAVLAGPSRIRWLISAIAVAEAA